MRAKNMTTCDRASLTFIVKAPLPTTQRMRSEGQSQWRPPHKMLKLASPSSRETGFHEGSSVNVLEFRDRCQPSSMLCTIHQATATAIARSAGTSLIAGKRDTSNAFGNANSEIAQKPASFSGVLDCAQASSTSSGRSTALAS